MISIIICGRNSQICSDLSDNITNTIGCEYELVYINNSRNQFNIFQAYNKGVAQAKGNILCFVHDDVRFRTNNWGNIIIDHLSDPTIGLIGVAGSHFMSQSPIYWWAMPYTSQYNLTNDKGSVTKEDYGFENYNSNGLSEVAVVDGVCFFIPRSLFKKIRFDDKLFNGFHAYDMDICMQVQSEKKRVCVTRNILIEHFWSPTMFGNSKYMRSLDKNMTLFCRKWASDLPIIRGVYLSDDTISRINNLCTQAYDAQIARNSKRYRIGKILLAPSHILHLKKVL